MKIGILIGSIRPSRITDREAKWVATELKKRDGVEVTMIDLMDYQLPMFAEAVSPQYNPDRKPEGKVKEFLDVVAAQNSIILVTPEYNRSYSSVLKNALDYIDFQLKRKPVLLVAHGSSGGAQAVAHLRGVLPGLLAVTAPTAVMVAGWLSTMLDENGQQIDKPDAPKMPEELLTRALDDFLWYSQALSEARSRDSTSSK